jgi:hypothetical protein
MKEQKTIRIFYDKHGVRIARDELQWTVSNLRHAGKDALNAGELMTCASSYHPSLASACEEAAYRIADQTEKATLADYARKMREAIADLREMVDAASLA